MSYAQKVLKITAFISHVIKQVWEGNGSPLQYSGLENPWTEEPGRLQTTGPQSMGHSWATFTFR